MSKAVLLFSGQGAQKVGMGKDLVDAYPVAQQLFEQADEVLGRSLTSIMFEGPNEDLTKTGNCHARWMLIECASHYSHAPKVSPQLSARQAEQSHAVKIISWRAQKRLNYRFRRLSARGLHRNKVVVAIARELCGFLWELHLQVAAEVRQSGTLKRSKS